MERDFIKNTVLSRYCENDYLNISMQTAFQDYSLPSLECLIDYAPLTVGVETTIWDAITLMNKSQPPAQHLLVVEDWQAVGLFSWEDVLQVVQSEVDLKNSKITEVMNTSVIKLRYSHLQDKKLIFTLLTELRQPLLIEDEKEQLVGYILPEIINNLLLKNYHQQIIKSEGNNSKHQDNIPSPDISGNQDLENISYFKHAIENSSEGIVITDINSNIIYANTSFNKIFGYTVEELNLLGGLSFVWKDIAGYQKALAAIKQGKLWNHKLEIKNRKGDISYIQIRTDAIKNSMGEIIGIISIHTNITEEVRIQEALVLKKQAIDASKNGVVIFDIRLASKPIVYANPEFESICRNSLSEGLEQENTFVENISNQINKLLKLDSSSSSKEHNIILRNYCIDGNEYWYQFSFSPVFHHDKKITHYICIQTDVTKHKQIEMSLLITREKLQHLLFSSTGVIYSSDCYDWGGVNFISDNVIDITGYEAEEILCDYNFWLSHIHPEDVDLFVQELSQVFTQNKISVEYRLLHKNGNYLWIYEQSRLVKDNLGSPLEIVGYRIDITERKQLEEDLQQALEKEKELNELKSRFISMTSHEFRTPLSTILSSSELLENYRHKWDEAKQLKHFRRIINAVQHMNSLLNSVLFIGKVEADKLDSNPDKIDLVQYSRQLVEDFQINQAVNAMGQAEINIDFIFNKEIIVGYFDDKILSHILNNLLSNAIKYSQAGTTVKFSISSQESLVLFEIQDAGIGIPPEDLPSLFDSFYRCQNVGNIPGTGLGLSIVKKCVDLLQGNIEVTSEIGVGTKFTIILPSSNNCEKTQKI